MNAIGWDDIRVALHILAATVWVGGQITLAALVPVGPPLSSCPFSDPPGPVHLPGGHLRHL